MATIKSAIGNLTSCKLIIIVLLFMPVYGTAYEIENGGFSPSLNCSAYCECTLQDIQRTIHAHHLRHRSFTGQKYGEDDKYVSRYKDFLGMYSLFLGAIIEIKCDLSDGRTHSVSSLLNGIGYVQYTSLMVSCRSGERLIWDVPSWQLSFNVFESSKCKVEPDNQSQTLVVPMNMWIFLLDGSGQIGLNQIDLRYTINTLVFSVSGTDTYTIPDEWADDYMISVDQINLPSNKLKRFECKLQLTKELDVFNLNKNELSKFPECILTENYENIRLLSLSENGISDISCLYASGPFRSTVEMIDLSHNEIETIGKFTYMKDLHVLDMSFNEISQINDDAFINLQDLKKLYLQNNRILYIGPVAFRDNVNLASIRLYSNLLKFVRVEQFPANEKIEIDLRKNKLRVPPFIQGIARRDLPANFKVLSANNPYNCDCAMIDFEEYADKMDSGVLNCSKSNEFFADLHDMKCMSPRSIKGKALLDIVYTDACSVVDNCPPNCDCALQEKSTFVVNCSSRRLLEMPETIPIYPNAKVVFDMSHNPLQLLSYRWYLSDLSELYMDNCLITSVTPSAINALHGIAVLRLHNNLLQKLPSNMKNVTLKSASNVTLHNNRWSCSCDSLWFPRWMSAHRNALWMPGTILCNYLKKPVEDFHPGDVNCDGYPVKDIIMGLSLVVLSILSTFFIFFNYSKDIKLFLYSKLNIRMGSDFNYGDQFSPYDIFVSYGQENYKWVIDVLVPHLEEEPHHLKLCLHSRDFPTDESAVDNIPWAIRLSRCSILVLSKEFMNKEWRIMELRATFQRMLLSTNKLIIITTDQVRPSELTADLNAYMNTHPYLTIEEPRFWEKLEMFIPPKVDVDEIAAQLLIDEAEDLHVGSGDTIEPIKTPCTGPLCRREESEQFVMPEDTPSVSQKNFHSFKDSDVQ